MDELCGHVRTLNLQFDVLQNDSLHSEVAVVEARSSLAQVRKLLNKITEISAADGLRTPTPSC